MRLRAAGLRTVMLTGDQRATAAAVGRELNLLSEGQSIIDGRELDALSDSELDSAAVEDCGVQPHHAAAQAAARPGAAGPRRHRRDAR